MAYSPYGQLPAGYKYTPRGPKPGPGFVVNPRTGQWVKKSVATPGKTGSADPSGALGGFTDLQKTYLGLAGRGPDYSGIQPFASEDALTQQAGRIATSRFQPGIDSLQRERGYRNAQRKVSSEAATNFAAALTSIFTGGKPGAEGEAYSLENFGGSYLAGVAAMIGQQLMSEIGHAFNEEDFQLVDRLDQLMDKYPEEAERIYGDLVSGEQERIKGDKSIADAGYKEQLAAIASAINFERNNAKDRSLDEHRRRQDLLAATKALGAGKAKPLTASQRRILLDNANAIVVESLDKGKDPAYFEPAVEQARRYLRDNGMDPAQAAKWRPYGTAQSMMSPVDDDAPTTRPFKDGTTREWDPTSRTWVVVARAPADKPGKRDRDVNFYKVRKEALAHARTLWKSKDRPVRRAAFDALMAGYGEVLIGAGYPRKRVVAMVNNVIKSASAARWDKVGRSGSGSGGFDWGS